MTTIFMPTKVFFDKEVIQKNSDEWVLGKTALLVTGRHSARLSGAQADVLSVLRDKGVEGHIFDQVENDPSLETIQKGAVIAKEVRADFIIGIGGGSPLDAAKAIAVLAINVLSLDELFNNQFSQALPIVAIPTTAGTGSEVTPYSVLYRTDLATKVSFGNALTFPKIALLDAKYTASLAPSITIDTAIDAFTHSFEGFLSNRATDYTDLLAGQALKLFGEVLGELGKKVYSEEIRRKLLYISLLGGIVISHTGVTIVHGMGYAYTVHYDIPHGKANGFLLNSYMDYLEKKGSQKLNAALSILGYSHQELANGMVDLLGLPPKITTEQIRIFSKETLIQQGSIRNTYGDLTENDIIQLWLRQEKKANESI